MSTFAAARSGLAPLAALLLAAAALAAPATTGGAGAPPSAQAELSFVTRRVAKDNREVAEDNRMLSRMLVNNNARDEHRLRARGEALHRCQVAERHKEAELQQLRVQTAELQAELVQVQATAEECRRLEVDEHGILVRVVASPTGRRAPRRHRGIV